MKIDNGLIRYNYIQKSAKANTKEHMSGNGHFCTSKSRVSFTSDLSGTFQKVVSSGSITYKNANKIVEKIDSILGKQGFLASNIAKANLKITDGALTLEKHTFLKDAISTIKYPFIDMPFDILGAILKGIQKTPLHSIADKISNLGIIKKQLDRVEAQKSLELVGNIFEQFCTKNDGNISEFGATFAEKRAAKITKTVKNYASRDERTINRLLTAGIGAMYSAKDMHNVSMLEKDDKNAAKKAEKDRWEQEMTRVIISAGLTFFTVGALNRYTKNSSIGTALVIAGSALVAEIISRVNKHKSLIPLTPEKAAKIAKKQEEKNKKNNTQISMLRLDKSDKKNKLYGSFMRNNDVENAIVPKIVKAKEKSEKKAKSRNAIYKILGLCAAVSALYLSARYFKGEYTSKIRKEKFISANAEKIKAFLEGKCENLGADLIKEADEIAQIQKDGLINKNKEKPFNLFKFFDKIKEIITTKNVEINLNHVEGEINTLIASENCKDVASILEVYQKQIQVLKANGKLKYNAKVTNPIPNALFEGLTKIFKAAYTILSAPARGVYFLVTKNYTESEELFEKMQNKLASQDSSRLVDKYKKSISEFNKIFNKNDAKPDKYQRVAKMIRNHITNFEESPETGELANLARTLVTLISSYFYVNDFRNTVLIESKGQHTQRAREVMNDSIGFKTMNYVFNGTLMNLANSLFKDILNGSLIGAAAIATGTEFTNEFLIRKTISRPMHKLNSRQEVIDYERSRANRKGFAGLWTRTFKKITGQKSLSEKYASQKAKKN